MAESLLQLALALTPAIAVSLVINRVRLPWEKQKRISERAEILALLARDIRQVKSIMARNLAAVKACPTKFEERSRAGHASPLPVLPLTNWKRIKTDERLRKYTDEPIFRTIINQLSKWEKA